MENPLRRHSSTSRTRRCTARRAVTLAVLPVVAYLTGCVTTNFTQPVASFQKSINTTTAAVGVYYTTLNSFERDLYLTHLALNPGEPLEATDKAGSPTPLLGTYFQPASIAARMDTLSLLGVYAQKLTDLAGNDAPQQAATATTALGASVTNLTTTFTGLTDPKAADKSAAQYVAPVSALG